MSQLSTLEEQLPLFQALNSEIRIRIMELILAEPGITIKQIADHLSMPSSTLSPHIGKLADSGLIRIKEEAAAHGMQKRCFPELRQIIVNLDNETDRNPVYHTEIPIGQYSDFDVTPTCGLATTDAFLGTLDEPRLFAHPDRRKAGILWFTTGYIEYVIPNFAVTQAPIEMISLSFEIASEAPRHEEDWPSLIVFSLNGTKLGEWISPGDYGNRRGRLNPSWWYPFLNQYGLLKTLTLSTSGCYMDGQQLSSVTTTDLALDSQSVLKFRFEVPAGGTYSRGLTLYGQGFGDYSQHIRVMIQYKKEP